MMTAPVLTAPVPPMLNPSAVSPQRFFQLDAVSHRLNYWDFESEVRCHPLSRSPSCSPFSLLFAHGFAFGGSFW